MIRVAFSKSGANVAKIREDFAKKNRFLPIKKNQIRLAFNNDFRINF
jgi:hypothetical protein